MASTKNKVDLESSFRNLKIDPSATSKPKPKSTKKSKTPVADSWEDEASSSAEEEEADTPTAPSQIPSAPPPTPISPSSPETTRSKTQQENQFVSSLWESNGISQPRERGEPQHRPEKTDAVAKRMIAGALGIKAPKKTEDQKAYEKAIREGERARKEKEREEARRKEEQKERARREVWED